MRACQKGSYEAVQYHYDEGRNHADYYDGFQHIHYVLFHFFWLSVLYDCFLQIVTFAGIYFKLGDLMTMFSLQSSDTQQVSRRIMRRPYMFLNRRARRLERKIGRTVAAGAAGGVAGAAAASASTKKQIIQNQQAAVIPDQTIRHLPIVEVTESRQLCQ